MSNIPNQHASAQVAALALTLSPYQRYILAKAGEARWFDLPHPWLPLPGAQESTARALAEGETALLAPVAGYLGAYELTPLGERVAAAYLRRSLHPEPVARDLAARLTPLQRSVLAQVAARGVVPVSALSSPRASIVARFLASPELGVLHTTSHGYTLSPLGVQVMPLLAEVG